MSVISMRYTYICYFYTQNATCKLNSERNIYMKKEWEYVDCRGCTHFSVECQQGVCCLRLYPHTRSYKALIFLRFCVTSDTS